MINIALSALLCVTFTILSGCTKQSPQPVAVGRTIAAYFTKKKVLIDSERGAKEWMACESSSCIKYKIGKSSCDRHYVQCMYDDNWLYLSIETFYRPDFGPKRSRYFSENPRDSFPLKILSDDKEMLSVKILSDGTVFSWPFSILRPAISEGQDYVKNEYGITVSAVTDNHADGSMTWHSEIRLSLKNLKPIGNKIMIDISGAKCRLNFYPKILVDYWALNAL